MLVIAFTIKSNLIKYIISLNKDLKTKKVLALSTAALIETPTLDAEIKIPTLYRKVNKAIMYVDQESKFEERQTLE